MALVWVATAPIYAAPNIRAYNSNDIVPDSAVASWGLEAEGLVVQRDLDISPPPPWHGTDPVTQAELDALTTGPGRLSDESLRAAYVAVVNPRKFGAKLDGTTDDSAAIATAFNSMKDVNGHASGLLYIDGPCRIATPIVLDGGYANVPADNPTFNGTPAFSFQVTGHLIPDAGIGKAVTVSGFMGAVVDARFKGGGDSTDVALHCENLVGLDLSVYAEDFAGIVLHADATGDTTKRIRRSTIRRVYADGCGQAIYWKWIEAFGTFQDVFDNGSVNGSYFGFCADTGITKWENWSPATQATSIHFESCNSMNLGILTLGDRPTEALLKISGGAGGVSSDFGRINQVRVSGQPGVDPPVVTGLLLQEVNSIDIDTVQSFRCARGVAIVGGANTSPEQGGIRIKQHRSMTTDVNPLTIDAGTSTAPRIEIHADYRFHEGASVKVGPGLTGGLLRLSGYLIDMHTSGGATGKYAVDVDATSGGLLIDVTGLWQVARTGLAGFTNHPTVANISGVARARIENTVRHGTVPSATNLGIALGTAWENTSYRTANVILVLRYNPDTTTSSAITMRLSPSTASPPNLGNSVYNTSATVDLPITDTFVVVPVPPYWFLTLESSGVGAAVQSSHVYYV